MTVWTQFVQRFSGHFRDRRNQLITSTFPNLHDLTVCDLGGSLHFWERWSPDLVPTDLTLLNIGIDGQSSSHTGALEHLSIQLYDGHKIPYPDDHFDVLICNSVIEHVALGDRSGLAEEIQRVSKYYFVQTPAAEFPIEPHFVLPFVHWLPRRVGVYFVPFGLWAIMTRPTKQRMRDYFEEVHLLTRLELASYFPGSTVAIERLLLMPKSYTVHRGTRNEAHGA